MKEQDLGMGSHIVGFDSTEEMFAYLAERRAAMAEAMLHLAEPQRRIIWGSYCVRMHPISETEVLAIFGQIYTEEEIRALELAAGSDEEELSYTMAHLRENYAAGYRYGWWASVIEKGEPGDAHVSLCWPITRDDYEAARANQWEMSEELYARIYAESRAEQEGS
jgi:hypothetical protein